MNAPFPSKLNYSERKLRAKVEALKDNDNLVLTDPAGLLGIIDRVGRMRASNAAMRAALWKVLDAEGPRCAAGEAALDALGMSVEQYEAEQAEATA